MSESSRNASFPLYSLGGRKSGPAARIVWPVPGVQQCPQWEAASRTGHDGSGKYEGTGEAEPEAECMDGGRAEGHCS